MNANANANQVPVKGDPVTTPLRVLSVGLVFTVVTMLLAVALFCLIVRDAPIAPYPDLMSLLAVVGDGIVLAGCILLARAKRPGSAQALVSGVFHALGIGFVAGWRVLVTVGGLYSLFTLAAIANNLVDIIAVSLLALSLRDLAKSRGRAYDGWLFATIGLMACSAVGSLISAVSRFGLEVYLVTSATASAARVILVIVALVLSRHATLPDAQLAYDSAYRGPTGTVEAAVEGSLALGFLAGFFGGCIGAALVLALAKGPKTKRGAGIGFGCQVAVGIAIRAFNLV